MAKTVRLELNDPPALLAGICRDVNVFEELSCPVGHFKCPFHNTACSSVTPEMWEELMEDDGAEVQCHERRRTCGLGAR